MHFPFKIWMTLVVVLLCGNNLHAQSIEEIDRRIGNYLGKIQYWYDNPKLIDDNIDSLDGATIQLENYLKKVCIYNPKILTDPLKKASDSGLMFVTSADKKVRFFSWDTRLGGSMIHYNDIVLYNAGEKIESMVLNTAEDDYGGDYTNIIDIHTNDKKIVYLVMDFSKISTKDVAGSITAYVIRQGVLKRVPFFYTATKRYSQIVYGYDSFSYEGEDKLPYIHMSDNNKSLYIPIVIDEKPTNKYLLYKFDGNKFVFDKNAK